MEPKNVLLDFSLTDFSDAKVCDENSLIHLSKMDDFRSIFERQYAHAVMEFNSRQNGRYETRYEHNTISVFASRGAGKTTFLLSALARIKRWHEGEIACLKPIDPSMIERGENTFVDIVARIQEKVNATMEDRSGSILREDERDLKKSVEKSFKRLMDGMSFLDGIGKNGKYEDWDDAEYAALQGMEKAISSINIDEAFQDYVYKALRFIGKKCFVVSFDDIDTDFAKGFQILEVIRKYLTTPMVITVLTGDLELYGKLVRKASWGCFDKVFLEKERDFAQRNETEFSTMIDQLENQYLVKILKPENRIQLSSLKEYLSDSDYHLFVRFDETDSPQGYMLESCYSKLLKEIGAYKEKSKLDDELRQFMLGMSLRIQIRLLTQIKDLELMKSGKHDKHKLATGILSVFWNDINQKANNAKALTSFSPLYTVEMLKFLEFTKSIEIGATFLPETSDEILNKALFAIGTKYNEQVCKHNYLVFDYWIRISFIALIADRLWQNGKDNLSDILAYSQLKTDSGLGKSLCLIQAFYNSLGPNMPRIPGQLRLNDEPYLRANFRFLLSMLAAFGTEDSQKLSIPYFSIYRLLAVISDIMRVKDSDDEETDQDRILAQIYKMGQYRRYPVPKVGPNIPKPKGNANQETDEHFLIEEENVSEADVRAFMKKLRKWNKKEINVSCQSLNRIFVRFYHTLMALDSQTFDYPVAEKFSRMVLALLNATLVEDSIDNGITGLEMNTIGDIEQSFVNNFLLVLPSKLGAKSKFSFFSWLKDCPLLLTFVDPYIADMIERSTLPIQDMQLRHNVSLHLLYKKKLYREQIVANCEDQKVEIERTTSIIRKLIGYRRRLQEKKNYDDMLVGAQLPIDEYTKIKERIEKLDSELSEIQDELSKGEFNDYDLVVEDSIDELQKEMQKRITKRYDLIFTIRRMKDQIKILDQSMFNYGLQNDHMEAMNKASEKWKMSSAFMYLMENYPIRKETDDASIV